MQQQGSMCAACSIERGPLSQHGATILLWFVSHSVPFTANSCRALLFSYKNSKRLGKFAGQRPLTVKQQIEQSMQQMQEQCLAAITSAAELNWRGYEKLLHELTRSTVATQAAGGTTVGDAADAVPAAAGATAASSSSAAAAAGDVAPAGGAGTLPEDVVQNLQAMAAGELPPSPQQQQRIHEQLQQLELEEQEAQQQDVQQDDDCLGSPARGAAAAASQGQLLCTPSGAVRLLHEVAGRAADTMTPGGGHYTAFMTGSEQQLPFVQQPLQQQQQQQPQQRQQQQQQSDGQPLGLSDAEWQMVMQLRQQQQRPPGLSDAEWQLVQQTRQASRQPQARQQQQGSRSGSTLLHGMGTVEPLGEIALPHITAQGAAAAALGAAGAHTATLGCVGGSVPADGVVEALLELRQLIMQQQQSCSCAGMQQQQQPCQDQDMGEAEGAGEVQQQQQVQQQLSKKGVKPFPSLSVHTSLEALAHWYAVQPHHSAEAAGRTIKQMEDAGSHTWRAGGVKQRWSEYKVLLTAIEEKQEQLVDAQRRLGRRGVQVDLVTAAQKLDEERLALPNPNPKSSQPMSVCQFRVHLTAQTHAAAAARQAAEAADAGAAAVAVAAAAEQ
jgi:hypothetical protein